MINVKISDLEQILMNVKNLKSDSEEIMFKARLLRQEYEEEVSMLQFSEHADILEDIDIIDGSLEKIMAVFHEVEAASQKYIQELADKDE